MSRALVLLLACLAGAPLSAQTTSYARDAIDAYLEGVVSETRIPGIVAMAANRDAVLYSAAVGRQDVARGIPMSIDSIFRIASMTKPVTSVAVVMLIERGEVALDDPIAKHLPELANRSVIASFDADDETYTERAATTEMTVRHLLTHTSGLGYGFSSPVLAKLLGPDERAIDYPLLHEPGERWTYGESTRVLGTMVERVSGQPLEQFMREHIFEPLGMADTSYRVAPEALDRVVTIHGTSDGAFTEIENPDDVSSSPRGDGGLNSTAGDYVKFIQMFLRGGLAPDGTRLLSEASVELMGQNHIGDVRVSRQPATNPELAEPFPLGAGADTFGLGFQITAEHSDVNRRSPGSMSWAGIFNTEFWIDPARGIGGVLLMQYLPFYDEDAIETLEGFEKRVYESLE